MNRRRAAESPELAAAYRAAGFVDDAERWTIPIPGSANIAADTVARIARSERANHPALIFEDDDGNETRFSFAELDERANRLASQFAGLGVVAGQPVGIHLDQRPETAIVHLAIYKVGAIACTMSQLYGPDTLHHILTDTGMRLIFTREPNAALQGAIGRLAETEFPVPRLVQSGTEFERLIAGGDPDFAPVATSADSQRCSCTRAVPLAGRKACFTRIGFCTRTCRRRSCSTT